MDADHPICGVLIPCRNTLSGGQSCDLAIAWAYFSGDGQKAFRSAVSLDEEIWHRAGGWSLWTALVTLADIDKSRSSNNPAWHVVKSVIEDDCVSHRR